MVKTGAVGPAGQDTGGGGTSVDGELHYTVAQIDLKAIAVLPGQRCRILLQPNKRAAQWVAEGNYR